MAPGVPEATNAQGMESLCRLQPTCSTSKSKSTLEESKGLGEKQRSGLTGEEGEGGPCSNDSVMVKPISRVWASRGPLQCGASAYTVCPF